MLGNLQRGHMLKTVRERRRSERHSIDRFARIQGGVGSLPRECLIVDISDHGIRLHAENIDVPDQFLVTITGLNQDRRECRVIWRLGFEIGAEFTDDPRNFASHVAAAR
jgi:hypothetical protein